MVSWSGQHVGSLRPLGDDGKIRGSVRIWTCVVPARRMAVHHATDSVTAYPTGDLLTLQTDSWSFSLSRFGDTFLVTVDLSKAIDRVWHKTLLSKQPSFDFYPSLLLFSSFLSGRSISAVVDGHCSSPKHNGVQQISILSPTLFLLFINDLLSITVWPIHSYADDSTLHFSTSFDRRPTLQDLQDYRLEAAERGTSDLAIIFDWGKSNELSCNATKPQFLRLSTQHNVPKSYPLFFDNTQLSLSSELNILDLSLNKNLSWKLHISSLTKSASSKLGVQYRLRQFLYPAQLLSIYKGLVRPCGVCISRVCEYVAGGVCAPCRLLFWTERSQEHFVSSVLLFSLTFFSFKFRRHVASLSIFHR